MADGLVGVINAGSSSLKFALFSGEELALHGEVSGLGGAASLALRGPAREALPPFPGLEGGVTAEAAAAALVGWLLEAPGLAGVGHRVVHGGMRHTAPVRVSAAVLEDLAALTPLAPLHQPHNLAPIRLILERAPALPQVACFDTAFHATNPDVARVFALPRAMRDAGIRRYGFHGLSCEFIASALPAAAPAIADGRVIVLHLGNGASLCAMAERRSVASTMGFSVLDGLPMGTRCGDLDPGVVLYLLRERGMTAAAVEDLLYHESGLLGLSGVASDMRALLARDDAACRFAVAVFCYRAAREIGSLAAALGGVDGLVFTAGIGEHAAPVRARICALCAWLGVRLDADANARHGPRISEAGSQVQVWVVPTDEERMIARHARGALGLV